MIDQDNNLRNSLKVLKSNLNKIRNKRKITGNYLIDSIELEHIKNFRHQAMLHKLSLKHLPIIDFLTVAITNVCNLRCVNCSAHIPLIKKAQHFDTESFETHLNQISKLSNICTLNIEGAEPFAHPLWHHFAAVALKYIPHKIGGLSFFTNGTIIPRQEQLDVIANNENVYVCISDYGEVSKKINKLFKVFSDAKIQYYLIPYPELKWNKVSSPHHFKRSDSQLKFIFSNCRGRKYCPTIRQGIFTKCGGIFKIFDVLKLPILKKDFFSYAKLFEQGVPLKEIQKNFNVYLNSEKFLETCNYCQGLTDDMARTVTAGQQYKQ